MSEHDAETKHLKQERLQVSIVKQDPNASKVPNTAIYSDETQYPNSQGNPPFIKLQNGTLTTINW